MPKAKPQLHTLCSALVPARAGDFAQALMDLGSAICTSRRPACANCPWTDDCRARKRGIQEQLPVKAPKIARPLKRGAAFVVRDKSGAVLLVKRPEKGLLASMLEPPLGPWAEKFPSPAAALKQAPFEAKWKKRPGIVRHGFTHFELEIEVYVAEVVKRPTHLCHPRPNAAKAARGGGDPGRQKRRNLKSLGSLPSARETRASPGMTRWVKVADLYKVALPTVMRKIIEHGLDRP
jgi:A/G-specific adenine glycosylase